MCIGTVAALSEQHVEAAAAPHEPRRPFRPRPRPRPRRHTRASVERHRHRLTAEVRLEPASPNTTLCMSTGFLPIYIPNNTNEWGFKQRL